MKRIPVLAMLTALLALWTVTVFATVPHLLNFQGVLKDANGSPVANGSYQVKFEIFNSVGPGGGCLWQENQQVGTQGGLFSAVLGATVPIPDSAFNDSARWLAITVGNDPELSPRQRLVSVGYSYRVGTVDGATGGVIHGNTSIQSDLAVAGAMDAKNLVLNNPGPSSTPLSIQGSAGQTVNLMEAKDNSGASMFSIKPDGSFESKEGLFKRFAVFGHSVTCGESLKVNGHLDGSGGAEIGGQDFLVSTNSSQFLNRVGIGTPPSTAPDVFLRVQSGTVAHELGHNFRLFHGGAGTPPPSDDFLEAFDESGSKVASIDPSGNVSVNHISAMGYGLQLGGISTNGDVNVGGNAAIGVAIANSKLTVGGAIATGVTVVSSPTSSITLDASHSIVLCNVVLSPITINLPAAAGCGGRQYTIKIIFYNFGSVIIDPAGSEMIEGASTYTLSGLYKYITIVSDGTQWWVIANN